MSAATGDRTRAHQAHSKPGLIYQHDLTNEIASLTNQPELPDSRYFPVLGEHGLRDGRVYLISSLFDEFHFKRHRFRTGAGRMVAHLRTAMEAAGAVITSSPGHIPSI
jgi:hypothetical protein